MIFSRIRRRVLNSFLLVATLLFSFVTAASAQQTIPKPPLLEGVEPASECGLRSSDSVKAIPFRFVVPRNKGRFVTLSAFSEEITHQDLAGPTPTWGTRYKVFRMGGGAAITDWIISNTPSNGALFEGQRELQDGDRVQDPDDLFFVPNPDFVGTDSFSYCVFDSSGQSNIAKVSLETHHPSSYPIPYGIDNPGFGIDEEPPGDPVGWPAAEVAGYYYIDSDDPSCTDNVSYGSPATPRCTIPSDAQIDGGKKMVLGSSAAPYRLRNSTWHRLFLSGAAGNEAWLVGDERNPDRPVVKGYQDGSLAELRIQGDNFRIGGITFDGVNLRQFESAGSNAVVRYSEIRNYPSTAGGGTTVGIGASGSNVLFFQVNAHDNGIICQDLCDERDIHAFVGLGQTGFWILDVMCAENAGDCLQLTNRNTTSRVFPRTRYYALNDGELR